MPAPSARALAMRSPLDLCELVDGLGTDATGQLSIHEASGSAEGAVFVERGQICWAAARGLAWRLGDMLAASAGVDAAGMKSLYRLCKRDSLSFGEHIVRSGLVKPAELRTTLLRHSAESLRTLCHGSATARWTARPGSGYRPRFTFSTPELLARTFADMYGSVADHAASDLADMLGEGDWGAAFVRSGRRAVPDPVAVRGAAPNVDAVMRLGQWAVSSLDVVGMVEDDGAFVVSLHQDFALVGWRSGTAVFAGWTSVHGPARLLNRRSTLRRKEACHGRV